MTNYLLIIEYDGSAFSGWQIQPVTRTVQFEIKKAAEILLGLNTKITAAGRTDKGVHALSQAINLQTVKTINPTKLLLAFNSILPKDVAVISVKEVSSDFNARFSAKKKVYQYFIWNKPCRSVWKQKYSWHISETLDIQLMKKAAFCLYGEHDFSAFDAKGGTQKNKKVKLDKLHIRSNNGTVIITFEADRFLYKMVRNIVGTLVEVGLGRILPEKIKIILEGGLRNLAGETAPACGLFLKKVIY